MAREAFHYVNMGEPGLQPAAGVSRAKRKKRTRLRITSCKPGTFGPRRLPQKSDLTEPSMRMLITLTTSLLLASQMASADGPSDNVAENVRQVPPAGIDVPAAERAGLERQLAVITERLSSLSRSKAPLAQRLTPDVEIFARAVRDALQYNEFFSPGEIKAAADLLRTGIERADQLTVGGMEILSFKIDPLH